MSDEAKSLGLIDPPKLPTSRGDIAAFTICSGLAYLLDTIHNVYGIPPGAASVYCGSIAVGIKNVLQAWFDYRESEKERKIAEANQQKTAENKKSELVAKVKLLIESFKRDVEHQYANRFDAYSNSLETDVVLFNEGILTIEDFERAYDAALKPYREWRVRHYKDYGQ